MCMDRLINLLLQWRSVDTALPVDNVSGVCACDQRCGGVYVENPFKPRDRSKVIRVWYREEIKPEGANLNECCVVAHSSRISHRWKFLWGRSKSRIAKLWCRFERGGFGNIDWTCCKLQISFICSGGAHR